MNKNSIIILIIILIVAAVGGYLIGKRTQNGVPVNGGGYKQAGGNGAPPTTLPGRDDAAVINELKEKIANNPKDAASLAYLGDIYLEQRRFKEAIVYYTKAVAIDPNDVDTYNDLGLANHYDGNSLEGLRAVEEGIKVDPYFQRIWLTKGFILAATGRIPEAREAWRRVVAIDSESGVGKAASSFLAEYQNNNIGKVQ